MWPFNFMKILKHDINTFHSTVEYTVLAVSKCIEHDKT